MCALKAKCSAPSPCFLIKGGGVHFAFLTVLGEFSCSFLAPTFSFPLRPSVLVFFVLVFVHVCLRVCGARACNNRQWFGSVRWTCGARQFRRLGLVGSLSWSVFSARLSLIIVLVCLRSGERDCCVTPSSFPTTNSSIFYLFMSLMLDLEFYAKHTSS